MKDFFKWDEVTKTLVVVIVIMLVAYLAKDATLMPLEDVLSSVSSGTIFEDIFIFARDTVIAFLPTRSALAGVEIFLSLVAFVLFGLSVWFGFRAEDVHHEEDEKYAPLHIEEIEAKEKMVQWQVVLNHINSESPAEWKLAILEADNMLDSILESEGYRGETIGEKLKAVEPGDLASYNEAWEAHKVRNQIAHEGAATMDFSKKMARDTIGKFEKVFKELGYI